MFETNTVCLERKIKNKISNTSIEKLRELKSKSDPKISVGWKEQYPDKPIVENIETYKSTPLTEESIKSLVKQELKKRG